MQIASAAKLAKLVAFGAVESVHRLKSAPHREDGNYVWAAHPPSSRRFLRGRRVALANWAQRSRCGCRAAHTNIANEMPRSSCCPDGHE